MVVTVHVDNRADTKEQNGHFFLVQQRTGKDSVFTIDNWKTSNGRQASEQRVGSKLACHIGAPATVPFSVSLCIHRS